MARLDVSFESGGATCSAWHYRPDDGGAALPCIVMAHGFGATRNAGLEPYAERFCGAGYHVLLFDYRHFGDSGGEPRQLLSIRHQLQDWAAAIDCARQIDGVDADRVALWGSSFSGGYVVSAAARDGRVAAISAQGPMMDGRAAFLIAARQGGVWASTRLLGHALVDAAAAIVGRAHTVAIVGPPHSTAMIATPDAEAGFRAIAPEDFINRVAARVGLTIAAYRPVKVAHKVPCPALIQICEDDSLVSNAAAEMVAERMGDRATLIRYPIGHFDIYVGEGFTRGITAQLEFFGRHLRG